jgi:hypothetical protein
VNTAAGIRSAREALAQLFLDEDAMSDKDDITDDPGGQHDKVVRFDPATLALDDLKMAKKETSPPLIQVQSVVVAAPDFHSFFVRPSANHKETSA